MKARDFWCNVIETVGEGICIAFRVCNKLSFLLLPVVALGLVGYNRVPDAVACLAIWAMVVTGIMTIKPPAGNNVKAQNRSNGK